jgi:hypothetical protein
MLKIRRLPMATDKFLEVFLESTTLYSKPKGFSGYVKTNHLRKNRLQLLTLKGYNYHIINDNNFVNDFLYHIDHRLKKFVLSNGEFQTCKT